MSVSLPNERLEFDTWYADESMDREGRVEVFVRLNTYTRHTTGVGIVDMGHRRADKRLARLRRRAERIAAHRNRAAERAKKVLRA